MAVVENPKWKTVKRPWGPEFEMLLPACEVCERVAYDEQDLWVPGTSPAMALKGRGVPPTGWTQLNAKRWLNQKDANGFQECEMKTWWFCPDHPITAENIRLLATEPKT